MDKLIETHVYLYGIVPAGIQIPLLPSIDTDYPLYSIVEHSVQAIVSQVRPSIFTVKTDELTTHQKLTRLVMVHERIVSAFLELGTIVPASFATILNDDNVACALLKKHASEWQAMLDSLKGCVEVTLQAAVNEDALSKELELATSALPTPSSGTSYLMQRMNKINDKTKLTQHLTEVLAKLHKNCAKISHESLLQPIEANTADECGRKFHMRACYLVERDKVAKLNRIIKRHSKPLWLYLTVSKPFAPYHFTGKL